MKKQLFLFLLILLPLTASADNSGTCGDNLTWTYEQSTHTLTISGSGDMYDFYYKSDNEKNIPWYSYHASISNIIIEDGVNSIGDWAFYNFTALSSITFSNSVTKIGDRAFYRCKSITSINIPNSVTSIGNGAFYNCSSLTSIDIPNSVTNIGEYAFFDCSSLTSINIPNSVTSIGNSAFYGCSSLTSIDIPIGVTSIEYSTFVGCSRLTSINIPNSVTSIGNSAFYGCSSLTSIDIPIGVTEIKYNTFYGCSSLTSINIPNSVTSIGNSAFYGCSGLTSLNIPNGVTSIGSSAFYNCYNLTSINISSSVQNIGESAFRRCPRLHTIYSLNPIPPNCHGTQTFSSDSVRNQYDIYDYAVLRVPMGSKEIYGSAYEWRYFEKVKEDMQLDGNIYYANLTVQQGTTGYTRQAIKAGETYTIYIGSFGDNRVNAVTFNGVDVTEEIVNGNYTTPEITGESVLCISYEIPSSAPSLKLNNVKVMGYNGEITISNIDEPSDISIYSADGKIIENIPSASGTAKISVTPDQLYVVKVGSRTYKIALYLKLKIHIKKGCPARQNRHL